MTKPAAPSAKPELLAPAGSLEAFFAAMENGADAVYCGLRDFSARAKAKNFTVGDVGRMAAYARSRGRRVYVTLNTLVKEGELPHLAETLGELEGSGIGGIILQDLAVWRLARQHFPGLELHASTQMTVHNIAGVKMLERMGFTRGVLARELSLAEITAIRRATTLELEHFIHGALCFCFSGQCFFSSWLGGKSGNRGRCAQPCRRRYSYRQQDGYFFSPNDLSAVDLLPELAAAGVCSFKIEGRMKSAEYVANVVGAYRAVLDAPPGQRPAVIKEAKEKLKLSFGRAPTKGFLPGGIPTDIVIPSQTGATGRFLGEVSAARDSTITFKTRDRLHLGDRLRVQPKTDQAGTAFTLKELRAGRQGVKLAAAGTVVTVPHTFGNAFKVGDSVFKVSSEQAFTLSEAACRRRLEGVRATPTGVKLHLRLAAGELHIRASVSGAEVERAYPVATIPADSHGLDRATLEKVFAASGDTPFVLESLGSEPLPAVVVAPSRLKEIRREFYRDLAAVAEGAGRESRRERLRQAVAGLLPAGPITPARERQLTVVVGDGRDAHILGDREVDRVIIPLTPANAQGMAQGARRPGGKQGRVIWELPFILLDSDWEAARSAVKFLVERGFTHFRLNNLGHFPLFDGVAGVELSSGYRLFSLNSQARLAWKELGIAETTLYLEDDRDNLRQLLARDCGMAAALTVYGPVPLLTSRIPLRNLKGDTPVVSDRGDAYRVTNRDGLSVVRAETDFSLLGHLAEVGALGVSRLIVDLSHLGPFSPRGKKVLAALHDGVELPATSPFNFSRGME
ncbi:MAG: peptidase U32 [Desulfuromonadales bacterium GWD2_61_12]|nr:MAG: peptidase U32 [Desulfuromonadales bacterium GWD2_61_12]